MWNDIGNDIVQLLIGSVLSIGISVFAYYKRSLSLSGMIAAILMGLVITFSGGYYFMSVLIVFFITSSLLSKVSKSKVKDAKRTYKQVLANGVVGTFLSVLYFLQQEEVFKLLYTASFAISTADTWGSEIGRLSKGITRNILTWKPMKQGLSGGISIVGTLASLFGSIVLSAFYAFHFSVILIGFIGSVVDSLLGTVQVKYVGPTGGVFDSLTEDLDVQKTIGCSWLTNNLVNFLSNAIVISVAYMLFLI